MSNVLLSFWNGLGRGARMMAFGAAALVLGLLLWLSFGALRQDYRVLFSELADGDAATIVTRLKKDKVPYRLDDAGATILVPAEQVHDIRLALMSGGMPLSGGVGFEIFDKQGLGTTEHAQKVSYQRALQGELARTIGALDNVKQARVHLVMPESTLFTRDRQQASAAIAVATEPGTALQRSQIVGVQRLVAAAVPGLDPQRVVITDQRGITLSNADAGTAGTGAADARLEVKREIEEYLTHKIVRLLDSAFGPGQAIVSVDASLNFDSSKTTIQDLLPAAGATQAGEGRIVRRRQVTGASSQPMWTSAADGAATPRSPSSSVDVEYEYGRRIDEVIAAPGAITRMSVGVIVPGALVEEKRARIAELVRMAAGIDESRGDAVSVQPLSMIDAGLDATAPTPQDLPVESEAGEASAKAMIALPSESSAIRLAIGLGAAVIIVVVVLVLARRKQPGSLTPQDRQRILEEIQRTLSAAASPGKGDVRS